MYQHALLCSGSPYHPRRPGGGCSCHSSDILALLYRRLKIDRNREEGTAKRTIWAATCTGCGARREFPFTSESVPRETFCQTCSVWAKVEELSWDGTDFANSLPVLSR